MYNILGQEVRALVNADKPAGYHTAHWDGKDNFGKLVPSGVYIYRIETREFVKAVKMLLLK